jgi:apolipoprotein N-acyltransferase
LDLGNGARAGVSICYESTYAGLPRTFTRHGANVLMIITNDGWFGTSSAAFQHYEMGVMRAIENGRYLVRAGMFDALSVTADVRLLDGRTVYTQVGDLVSGLAVAITLGMAVWFRRDPRPTKTHP